MKMLCVSATIFCKTQLITKAFKQNNKLMNIDDMMLD